MTSPSGNGPDDLDAQLLDAAAAGDDRSVIAALAAGAEIDHRNEYGFDPLRSALWGARLATARLLVERGATVGVDEAAALGDVAVLDATWPTDPPVAEAIGAYLMACRAGQVASIEWFLGHGMPVDLHPPGDEWGGVGCPACITPPSTVSSTRCGSCSTPAPTRTWSTTSMAATPGTGPRAVVTPT